MSRPSLSSCRHHFIKPAIGLWQEVLSARPGVHGRRSCTLPQRALLVVSACGALACGSDEDPSGWSGTVRDSASVMIVENGSSGAWTENRRAVEEVLRIGVPSGDPDYQFGRLSGVAVGSDGRIFALDVQAQTVKVFNAAGTLEGTIGRPGAGPGELGPSAGPVVVGPGDTILVNDRSNARINRYAPDGASLGSRRRDLFTDGRIMRWRTTRSGRIVIQVRELPRPDRPLATTDALLALGADATVRDTMLMIRSGGTQRLVNRVPQYNLFTAEPSWALLDDGGILVGENDGYRLMLYGPDRQLRRIITREFVRQPVSARDRQLALEGLGSQLRRAGAPPAMLDQVVGLATVADSFPVFASTTIGPGGTVWVQSVRPPTELDAEAQRNFNPLSDYGGIDFDVFDNEGRYLGIVSLPERFRPYTFHEDVIYGVWRDDLDVNYVLGLRVNLGTSASTS